MTGIRRLNHAVLFVSDLNAVGLHDKDMEHLLDEVHKGGRLI